MTMAKHKAPTQVTLAPLTERSAIGDFVAKYWKAAALLAIAAIAFIVYSHLRSEGDRALHEGRWNDLGAAVDLDALHGEGALPSPEKLAPTLNQLAGSDAAPWGNVILARSLLQAKEFGRAQESLGRLKSESSSHPLVMDSFRMGESENANLVAAMEERVPEIQRWETSHPLLKGFPELPAGAPRVRLETSRGPIVVGLYVDRAPKHAENFLKLAGEGYYNGTRFHRVLKDLLIQGGDPNSRELDEKTWGLGGPEYTIPPEITDAWHFKGALAAAAKSGALESSGSQFYITATDAHQFDKQYTVFGRVLEGLELVEKLAKEAPEQSDRPEDPVVIESVTVL